MERGDRAARRHQDDAVVIQPGGMLPQTVDYFYPAENRHIHIQQHDPSLLLLKDVQCLFAFAGNADMKSLLFQNLVQKRADFFIVVNDQYFRHSVPPLPCVAYRHCTSHAEQQGAISAGERAARPEIGAFARVFTPRLAGYLLWSGAATRPPARRSGPRRAAKTAAAAPARGPTG